MELMDPTIDPFDQWLIRSSIGFLDGPMTKAQVIALIEQGKLAPRDEICQANQHWFPLYEREEVRHYLGIEIPTWSGPSDEEPTETETTVIMTPPSKSRDRDKDEGVLFTRSFVREPFWVAARWVIIVFATVFVIAILRLIGKLPF